MLLGRKRPTLRAVAAERITLHVVGGAVPPGPYFIRIAAANACGTSAPSVEVSTIVP